MHLVCQVSVPIVANIATFELPGRLSYFYLASLLASTKCQEPSRFDRFSVTRCETASQDSN
jgi:hypothetical protein